MRAMEIPALLGDDVASRHEVAPIASLGAQVCIGRRPFTTMGRLCSRNAATRASRRSRSGYGEDLYDVSYRAAYISAFVQPFCVDACHGNTSLARRRCGVAARGSTDRLARCAVVHWPEAITYDGTVCM